MIFVCMFERIPSHHFYNVLCSKSDFGQHFIISSLLYNAKYWVWNANAILRIPTCNAISDNANLHNGILDHATLHTLSDICLTDFYICYF